MWTTNPKPLQKSIVAQYHWWKGDSWVADNAMYNSDIWICLKVQYEGHLKRDYVGWALLWDTRGQDQVWLLAGLITPTLPLVRRVRTFQTRDAHQRYDWLSHDHILQWYLRSSVASLYGLRLGRGKEDVDVKKKWVFPYENIYHHKERSCMLMSYLIINVHF